MENSTPLTRCDTCHTVFEVPSAILDSVDSRVRCGECLQVFDASVNLHTASRPDFSLIDDTLVEGGSESRGACSPVSAAPESIASKAPATKQADIKQTATVGGAAVALADADASETLPAEINQDATGENHLEATMSDFDLFSDEASLPEVSYEFGENTIDAIRLSFDAVEDVADETLSDSLFANEVTIDASGLGVSTGRVDTAAARKLTAPANLDEDSATHSSVSGASSESGSAGEVAKESANASDSEPLDDMLRRSAKTGFVVEEGSKPATIEFDFSKEAATRGNSSIPAAAVVSSPSPSAKSPDNSTGNVTKQDTSEATGLPGAVSSPATSQPGPVETSVGETNLGPLPSSVKKRRGRFLLPGFLMLLTAALIAALYGYRERNNLADNPLTRPAYLAWCGVAGCTVPARFEKSQLKVVEKNIFSHPTLDDALVITVLLENNADFEQRYPALFVWLSDSGRRTVAENQFDAAEYLPENGLSLDSVMAPGQRQQISIDVRDPGRRAVSLELNLR